MTDVLSRSLPARPDLGFDPDAHRALELPAPLGRVRRALASRQLMHYHRLVTVVLVVNLAVAVRGVGAGWFGPGPVNLRALADAAVVNLSVAILIRQQHVINLLFALATAAPTSWPLPVRRVLGKVYHFGGIHVGGAVAGTAWFLALVVAAVGAFGPARLAAAGALAVLLVVIVITALPRLRAAAHDRFERVHRLGGWAALALFWVLTVWPAVSAGAQPAGPVGGFRSLVGSLSFWLLVAVTVSVALPWLRLRKVPVAVTRPSGHVALARFDHGVTPFAGSSTAISRNPLLEWHSFANVPSPEEDGFRLTISRAGDWTGAFIDDRPGHVWVKGIPTAGVGNIDRLFRRVVWVATGSGIGPTLPHLLSGEVPARLVWATRNPRATYGDELVDEILSAEPGALIWDTDRHGKPDMVRLAHQAVTEFEAEAVICISNKKLTWQVVEGMERIGVPAYGAIWDS